MLVKKLTEGCSDVADIQKNKSILDNFGYTSDKKEVLSWKLVEMAEGCGNHARLIAVHGIAAVPFVDISKDQGRNKSRERFYSDSDLKKWLNDTFLYDFFNEEERRYIKSVDIPSSEDIEKWFPKEYDRVCTPTKFAMDQGAAVYKNDISEKACAYWLSDTGRRKGMSAAVVLSNGKIYKSAYMNAGNVCVRPVIEVVRKEQRR